MAVYIKLFLYLAFNLCWLLSFVGALNCPDLCSCRKLRPKADLYRVSCSPLTVQSKLNEFPILEAKDLPPQTSILSIVGFRSRRLKASHLQGLSSLPLKKLILDKNNFKSIDSGAFHGLTTLNKLSLSHNLLSDVNQSSFSVLTNLKTLDLSYNRLAMVSHQSFLYLPLLSKVALVGNPFNCADCKLKWMRSAQLSFRLTGELRCLKPRAIRGKDPRLLTDADINCAYKSKSKLTLSPAENQVIFEGSNLTIRCDSAVEKSSFVKRSENPRHAFWVRNGSPVRTHDDNGALIVDYGDESIFTTTLIIPHLSLRHSGVWKCQIDDKIFKTINIVVVAKSMPHCVPVTIEDAKGVFSWPKTITGVTKELPCPAGASPAVAGLARPRAFLTCGQNGNWSNFRSKHCRYHSDQTHSLHQLAEMAIDTRADAKRLANQISDILSSVLRRHQPLSAADVDLILRASEGLLLFVRGQPALATDIISVLSTMLRLPCEETRLAPSKYLDFAPFRCPQALNRALILFDELDRFTTSRTGHFASEMSNFASVSLSLASSEESPHQQTKKIPCNMRIFSSLSTEPEISRLHVVLMKAGIGPTDSGNSTTKPCLDSNGNSIQSMAFSSFKHVDETRVTVSHPITPKASGILSTRSFNRIPVSTFPGHSLIDGTVVSVRRFKTLKHVSSSAWNFSVQFFVPEDLIESAILLRWTGKTWSESTPCVLSRNVSITAECSRLGTFALWNAVQPSDELQVRESKCLFCKDPIVIPSVLYGFTMLSCVIFLFVLITFVCFYRAIALGTRTKHSSVNITVVQLLLVCLFSVAIGGHIRLPCHVVAVGIHALCLTVVLWYLVAFGGVYKKIRKIKQSQVNAYLDFTDAPKPVMKYYLITWGISIIICGISAIVGMRYWSGNTILCFLHFEPSLLSFFIPLSVIISLTMIIVMMSFYIALSKGVVTRNHTPVPGVQNNGSTNSNQVNYDVLSSGQPTMSSSLTDVRQSPLRQLVGFGGMYLLMGAVCSLAITILVIRDTDSDPFDAFSRIENRVFSERLIFSYSAAIVLLSMWQSIFLVLSRQDVRTEWSRCCCRRKKSNYENINLKTEDPDIIQQLTHILQEPQKETHVHHHIPHYDYEGNRYPCSLESIPEHECQYQPTRPLLNQCSCKCSSLKICHHLDCTESCHTVANGLNNQMPDGSFQCRCHSLQSPSDRTPLSPRMGCSLHIQLGHYNSPRCGSSLAKGVASSPALNKIDCLNRKPCFIESNQNVFSDCGVHNNLNWPYKPRKSGHVSSTRTKPMALSGFESAPEYQLTSILNNGYLNRPVSEKSRACRKPNCKRHHPNDLYINRPNRNSHPASKSNADLLTRSTISQPENASIRAKQNAAQKRKSQPGTSPQFAVLPFQRSRTCYLEKSYRYMSGLLWNADDLKSSSCDSSSVSSFQSDKADSNVRMTRSYNPTHSNTHETSV